MGWMEIVNEVMQHEIVDAIKYLSELTTKKMLELKGVALKEFELKKEVAMQKIKELRSTLKEKLEDLKSEFDEKYRLAEVSYKKYSEKAKELVNKVDRFFEETTIADIVKFTMEKYEESLLKVEEYKVQMAELKDKYTKK